MESRQSVTGAQAGAWLLVLLLALSVAGFAITRVLRASDDVVNTVVLSWDQFFAADPVEVSFNTTVSDSNAEVLIIDEDERRVRALVENEPLPAGSHSFEWDRRTDAGELAPPGEYGLRVVLNDAGRDIVPPGRVTLLEEPAFDPAKPDGREGES